MLGEREARHASRSPNAQVPVVQANYIDLTANPVEMLQPSLLFSVLSKECGKGGGGP